MEQRVQQFHDDTKNIPKPPTAKTLKQLNTLRKFIFKNQDYRFSDKEKNKLFACIEAYFTVFDRTGSEASNVSAFPLIEDALKCIRYDEILAKQEGKDTPKNKESAQPENDEENYDDFDWDAFEKQEDNGDW
ncbi:hypothetical protein DFQ29_001120 [Apophysomyces sp. BC1021]|nr:hypothetical protein DFQ29_001120 [Apophysomyces sp. BC1021]